MTSRSLIARCALSALLIATTISSASAAATIIINNLDSAGEGFNDPTAVAPVGGNPGVTLGQQRLNVFQAAANVWGATLTSSVTIVVGARFDPLSCNATSAVLGSAGPSTVFRDFTGAEVASTWYHSALADKMAGADLQLGTADINATFNANLGQAGCLTGIFFYYGLDHNEGNNVDLFAVLLHELGHGLGFSSVTNASTGVQIQGFPGVYDRHILDNSNGLHWPAMSDAQRAASAINPGNVVWDGTAVNAKSASFLGARREVKINSPPVIVGLYQSGAATIGPSLTAPGFTANVVLAVDGSAPTSDACTALTNGAAMAGKIALIDRGTCSFNLKALAAQNAGAVGAIIVNNVSGTTFDVGGIDPSVTIPVASVSINDGNAIRAQLGSGVSATLRLNNARRQGADASNRVTLFTPNPLQSGSSVSHWDVLATPNLLMEPIINPDLTNIDLTRYAFEDIGWFPHTTAVGSPTPVAVAAGRNWPNPFKTSTLISFTLERPMSVSLDVFDLDGRRVRQLASTTLASGTQNLMWDGTDDAGRRLGPGVYLYKLRTGSQVETHRMVLLH